jgi:multiple sugar transport system substrate-binding protein
MSFSTCVLFYNEALFDQAGIAYPTADWTFADIQAAAEAIVAAGGEDTWGIYQPITYNELYKAVQTNGGSLLNADYTAFTVNTPENVAVLEAMLARVRDPKVMPTLEDMAGRGDWDMFTEGKLGMIVTGIWGFSTFAEQCDFPWDIVVEPGMQEKATFFFANVNCIHPDSKQQEAAARFIDAMGSDPDIVQLRLDSAWELPTIADQAKLQQYIEVTPPDNRAAVFESMDYAVAPPALIEQAAVAETINAVLGTLETNDMTAQEALDEIQALLEEADLL